MICQRMTIAFFLVSLLAVLLSCYGVVPGGRFSIEVAAAFADDTIIAEPASNQDDMMKIKMTINDQVFHARLFRSASTRAIIAQMPFVLAMDDYAAQEKIARLLFELPHVPAETPSVINIGDIYLWSGNNLVLFYATFPNNYNYVPVGYIIDPSGLKDALGNGGVEISFSVGD